LSSRRSFSRDQGENVHEFVTVDCWKKLNEGTSLAEASKTAGLTSLRMIAMEKRYMVNDVERLIFAKFYI